MRQLVILGFAVAAFSCSIPSGTELESAKRAPHALPWHPVFLSPDTTLLPVSDFLLAHELLERAVWEDGTELPIWNGEIVITQQPKLGIGFVGLWVGGNMRQIPVLRSKLVQVDYRLGPFYMDVGKTQIKGSFTGWAPIDLADANTFTPTTFHLPPGDHAYQVFMNGHWQAEPGKPMQPNGFGAFNSILTVPDASETTTLFIKELVAGEYTHDLVIQTDSAATVYGWWENQLYALTQTDSTGSATIRVPAAAYELKRTHLRIWSATERGVSAQALIPLEFGVPIQDPNLLTRDDRQAMSLYFLLVDRFANGDTSNDEPVDDPRIHPRANHHGGDFAGLERAIASGYFEATGVNTVWVSPIVTNPDSAYGWWSNPNTEVTSAFSGYHGYWPIRSTETDRRFGSMEDFNALVETAHRHGLNVLVDYVANHVHELHPVYQQHPDWATSLYLPDGRENTQLWDEQRLTTWFDTFMPTLDFSRPEVVDAMTDSAVWWIEHSEIDGFRHDATKHIPEAFWRSLTFKVKEKTGGDRNVFQIGETYGSPELIQSYLSSGMLDAQFDFNHYDAMVACFANDSSKFSDLTNIAEQSLATYGAHHLMGNITGNQDRPRFTSLADGSLAMDEDTKFAGWTRKIEHGDDRGYAKMQLLTAYLFSIPGVPCIYYGDEYADVGGNDPDNRKMMRFEGFNALEAQTKIHAANWAKLRASRMSMLYGETRYEAVSNHLLHIERSYLGEVTDIWINKSDVPVTLPAGKAQGVPIVGAFSDGQLAPWSAIALER